MLTLRQEQIDALRSDRRRSVSRRILNHLLQHWTSELARHQFSNVEFDNVVYTWVLRAIHLGFRSERDIRIFCEACACRGEGFPDSVVDADVISALDHAKTSLGKAQLIDEYLMACLGR